MKVKSNKEVHIRAFEAYRRRDNLKGILKPGFELEVEEVEGEHIEEGEGENKITSSKWYKDKNGDFYWSGGFGPSSLDKISDENNTDQLSIGNSNVGLNLFNLPNHVLAGRRLIQQVNYNDLVNIDQSLKTKKGKNALVAIVDHPINKGREIFTTGSFYNPDEFNFRPANDHGTFIAGLIGGNELITGIAPECKLIELPVYAENASPREDWLIQHLKKLEKIKDTVIVNISLSDISVEVETLINKLPDNIIVFASAGTDEQLIGTISQSPAKLDKVISVGSIRSAFDLTRVIEFSEKLNFFVSEFQFVSATRKEIGDFTKAQGDSFATAVVSGIASLIVSSLNNSTKINTDVIRAKLNELAVRANEVNRSKLIIFKK